MTVRLLRASAALLAVVVLAGCSWRLETTQPDWPSADPATQMRDAAAVREQAVIDAAGRGSDAGGSASAQVAVLSEIEARHAPERLDVLGGVYVPYPDASPSPSPAEAPPDVLHAAAQARDGHLADALVADDAELAFLLTSAGLSHALSTWYAGWVENAIGEASEPVVAERMLESESVPEAGHIPDSARLDAATLTELALMHDQARYAYEVLAARAADEERAQWLERRDLHAARGTALTDLPGVEDPREAVYVLPDEDSGDPAARVGTAQRIETSAGGTYAALLNDAESADRPWLLHAAFDAYAQAAAYGEPTAESYSVPALPGLSLS